MTWERFGYICRKVSAEIGEKESVSSCITRVDKDESCALYGKQLDSRSLPKKILDQIGSFDNKERAVSAVTIYQGLNLSEKFEEPMSFRRVVSYLSYVTFVFYIVVGIYQVKVIPTALKAFENFELSKPSRLVWYLDYFGYIIFLVSILLFLSLVVGYHLRKLFRFDLGVENSFIFKYLVFKSIRTSYLKVLDILLFPISNAGDQMTKNSSELINYLRDVQASNMSVGIEMQELLRIEMRILLEQCEQQMKYISTLVALAVVSAIFFFMACAYSPIFALGEMV